MLLAVVCIAVVHIVASPAAADDIKSALRAHLEEENSDDDEEVNAEPDRFRRASRRQMVAEAAAAPRPTPSASSDGPGVIGQAGHLAFKTFGRSQSITPIEVMPYILTDEHFIFGDLRGFVSNGALFGGNVGLGYRHLREDLNAWGGASVWYDADGTSGKNYQQIGLSFEALIDRWELRSNVYLPVTSAQTYSDSIGNARIAGNQLLFSRFIDQGTALRGVDVEAGYSLPVMERHRLRGFVGYYHFEGGPGGGVNGFKTRVEGVVNNSVTAQVLYTNDPLFGSNVMVGCQVQFPWGGMHPSSKWKQDAPSPFRFVERNYNVIVDRSEMTDANLVAFNPQTQAAYNIQQVSSGAAPGGNGTFANPFQSVAAAQAAGGDVILVRGNSVLTTGATLTAGQQLLGDGSFQPLALDGGGTLLLPTQMAGGLTPKFDGVTGAAVTMAANSTFAGFTVANNNGNGVVGSSVAGSTLRDVSFQSLTGDAIRFTNSSGNFLLDNVTVNTTTGSGISFLGGAPNLTLSGSVTGTGSDGILLSNLSGGMVDIRDTTIQSTGGSGLRLNNVSADVTVDALSTSQTAGSAVSITGGTAADTVHFTGTTTINTPLGNGFNVNSTNAVVNVDNLIVNSTAAGTRAVSLTSNTGKITLTNLAVNAANAIGLYGRDLTSLLVSNGTLTTVGAGAVDIRNSTIKMDLAQVSVDGGPFGIRLVHNTGVFNLNGGNAFATGGTIKNTTTGVILDSTGTAAINWLDLTSNVAAIQTIGNDQLTFNALRISGTTGYALDSINDDVLIIRNSALANNGTLGGGTIRAQASTVATYQWLIEGNAITDHNGTPILFQTQAAGNGASLATTVRQNTITADRAGATLVNVNWNGPLSAAVMGNLLNAGAANMTGIALRDLSATDAVNARVTGNTAVFGGNTGTGVLVSASASSTLQVDNNLADFQGVGGTGLRFNLGGVSSAWIYSNTVTDESGGATGMLFDAVAASSRLQIERNIINLLSTDLTPHRGIIFTTVAPTIQFAGDFNNIINNASTIFSIPVNSSTGHIIINGAMFP